MRWLLLPLICFAVPAEATWFLERTMRCEMATVPDCVERIETFEDESAHYDCFLRMHLYISRMDHFQGCLENQKKSLDDKIEEIEAERERVRSLWQCRSSTYGLLPPVEGCTPNR
jgi:hypothetical protein